VKTPIKRRIKAEFTYTDEGLKVEILAQRWNPALPHPKYENIDVQVFRAGHFVRESETGLRAALVKVLSDLTVERMKKYVAPESEPDEEAERATEVLVCAKKMLQDALDAQVRTA